MVILPRGEPVEARVGAMVIVVIAPSGDQIPSVAQVREQVLVETLVAQTSVEVFDKAVLQTAPSALFATWHPSARLIVADRRAEQSWPRHKLAAGCVSSLSWPSLSGHCCAMYCRALVHGSSPCTRHPKFFPSFPRAWRHRASAQPASSSALRSQRRALSAAWPRTPPCRQT